MQCTRELYFAFKAHLEEQARLRQQRIDAQRSNGAANGAAVEKSKLKVPVVGKVLQHAASTLWEHVKGNDARLSALLEAFRTFQTVRCHAPLTCCATNLMLAFSYCMPQLGQWHRMFMHKLSA